MAWKLPTFVEQLFSHTPNTTVPMLDLSRGSFNTGTFVTHFNFNPEMIPGINCSVHRTMYNLCAPLEHTEELIVPEDDAYFTGCHIKYSKTGAVRNFMASWKDLDVAYMYDSNDDLIEVLLTYRGETYSFNYNSRNDVEIKVKGFTKRAPFVFSGRPPVADLVSLIADIASPTQKDKAIEAVKSQLAELKQQVERLSVSIDALELV